jgi:hypothetical protein
MIKIGYSVVAYILQTEGEETRPHLQRVLLCYFWLSLLFLLYPTAAPPPEAAKSIRKQAPPHRGLRPTPPAPPGATTFAGISALSNNSNDSRLTILKLPCN